MFEPDKETDLVDEDDPFTKYYLPIIAYGPRREFVMEQVIPFEDPKDGGNDPITRAVDTFEEGDKQSAYQMMEEVLAEDLRCIDAHAHLGNWDFDLSTSSIMTLQERTRRHRDIRVSNKRKIRQVEMLDGLTGKRIIDE